MITLFRRIRQKLIDSGSVSKYLLYASGEILLVVLGILIALQVNNWNEIRKNNLERISFTESMISELAQDTLLLNSAIINFSDLLMKNSSLYSRLVSDTATFDTFKQIAYFEFDPSLIGRVENFNTVTISVLQSTGKIDLFSDALKSNILTHYSSLSTESVDLNSEKYFETTLRFSEKYRLNLPLSVKQPEPGSDNYAWRVSTQIADERDFVGHFGLLVAFRSLTLGRYLEVYTGTKASTVELIDVLKKSLE